MSSRINSIFYGAHLNINNLNVYVGNQHPPHNESADDRDLVTFSDFYNFHVKYKQQCNHLLLHLLLLLLSIR